MTKYFIFFFLFVFGFLINAGAQSLSFDQVRFEEYQVIVPGGTIVRNTLGASNLVVPAGKVLKIESITSGFSDASIVRPLAHNLLFEMYMNGKILYPSDAGNTPEVAFPIWLPAGTYSLQYLYNYSSTYTNALTIRWMISGIQFNVVP